MDLRGGPIFSDHRLAITLLNTDLYSRSPFNLIETNDTKVMLNEAIPHKATVDSHKIAT